MIASNIYHRESTRLDKLDKEKLSNYGQKGKITMGDLEMLGLEPGKMLF